MFDYYTPMIVLEYVSDDPGGEDMYGYVNVHERGELIDVITLSHDARLASFKGDPMYFALGVRQDGSSCRVYWECLPGWEGMDDAGEHCLWDKPYGVYDGEDWLY
jgi:hypothetical protein